MGGTEIICFTEVAKYFIPIGAFNLLYFIACFFGKRNKEGHSFLPLFGKFNSISVWSSFNMTMVTIYLFIRDGHVLMSKQAFVWIIGTVIVIGLTLLKRTIQKTTALKLHYKDAKLELQMDDTDDSTDDSTKTEFTSEDLTGRV